MFYKKLIIKIFPGLVGQYGKSLLIKKNKLIKGKKGGSAGALFFLKDCNLNNINYYFKKNIFFCKNGNKSKFFLKGKNGPNLLIRIPKNILLKDLKNNKILYFKNLIKINFYKFKNCKSYLIIFKKKINIIFLLKIKNFKKFIIFYNFYKIKKENKIFFYYKCEEFSILNNKKIFKNYFSKYFKSRILINFIKLSNYFIFIKIFKFINLKIYKINKENFYKFRILIIKINFFKYIFLRKLKLNIYFIKIFNWYNNIFLNYYKFNKIKDKKIFKKYKLKKCVWRKGIRGRFRTC
ncbi:GTPase involved in chromosome partitioning and ribosome assembly [Candidatus Nasuia deltocephalinicola str. NAS-ALF]|uniref:GTPase involved in chromosome partitioning and ribosome assembly n=1 Tax=Candidatus Nasuia deltocephalinicola str. NAS-ALF TaxID=1343077 RepID=S5SY51_9PROT|nr:GTPase involved in chromosome partitioning and ribosome assembly [Candidatus Nasuia deltocephalinicola str. NAS-ALF]